MTASFSRTLRQAGLVLAVAASFSALASTSSFAFSAEAQRFLSEVTNACLDKPFTKQEVLEALTEVNRVG